jgi:SAM-dependent methyltransferase
MDAYRLQRTCPICRSTATPIVLHRQTFVLPEGHILPDWYDLVACGECGFVYADTSASQDTYDKYYAEMSKYETTYTGGDNKLFADRASWISIFIHNRESSIIDVGCGNGQLLTELKMLGFSNLTALDPSLNCIACIREKGLKGIAGSIFDFTAAVHYEGVIMSGVLEHICDVALAMQTVKTMLTRNGSFFIFVPDASRYQDYDTIPYDYFNIEHINHFDETSLVNLGIAHGFTIFGLQKSTMVLSGIEQPVIYCAYRNEGRPAAGWRDYSRKSMLKYLDNSARNNRVRILLDELAASQEAVVVWGAGNYACRLLATSNLRKCNILMFVDHDKQKQGACLAGQVVSYPEEILKLKERPTILIAAAIFHDDILSEIKHMGIKNKVVVLK